MKRSNLRKICKKIDKNQMRGHRTVWNKPTLNLEELIELNMSHAQNKSFMPLGFTPVNFEIKF